MHLGCWLSLFRLHGGSLNHKPSQLPVWCMGLNCLVYRIIPPPHRTPTPIRPEGRWGGGRGQGRRRQESLDAYESVLGNCSHCTVILVDFSCFVTLICYNLCMCNQTRNHKFSCTDFLITVNCCSMFENMILKAWLYKSLGMKAWLKVWVRKHWPQVGLLQELSNINGMEIVKSIEKELVT